ncbi:MAG TPA: hypothetical protein VMM93_01050 [Vicinamibacterales bacterium]|nr:hypothetical protein [Vicinamibacterales bacterium]
MKTLLRSVLAALVVTWAVPALAQSRPLATEDPETVPTGFILLEGGFDYARDARFPASGLEGRFWRVGTFGLSVGVGSIAELQIDGSLRDSLTITLADPLAPLNPPALLVGDSTSSFGDLMVGAKVRFVSETVSRPAVAVRFATRLPGADRDSGLGLQTMDFQWGIGIAKTVQSVRVAGNAGFALLGDPVAAGEASHAMTYGFSVARAVAQGVEIVGELNGRFALGDEVVPVGGEDRSVVRIGSRYTRGPVRLDGAFLLGITEHDPTWGFTAGLTWVFRAFSVQ